MAAHLFSNPPSRIDFLNVGVDTIMYMKAKIKNVGNAPMTVTAADFATPGVPFSTQAPTLAGLVPFAIAAGAEVTFTVAFNPSTLVGGPGTAAHDQLTIVHTGDNSPYVIDVYGTATSPGVPGVDFNPSNWFADDGVAIITYTYGAELVVEVTNTSSTSITFQDIQFTPPFFPGAVRPMLPITIPPFGRVPFSIVFYPNTVGTVTQTAVTILMDIGTFLYSMSGTGVGITSFIPITGTSKVVVGVGTALYILDPTSFNCEEAGFFFRHYGFSGMNVEKALKQVGLRYENEGQVDVTVDAQSRLVGLTTTMHLGSVAADHWEMFSAVPLHVEGEVLLVEVDRAAGAGEVIIDEIDLTVDEWDEMETVDLLAAVASFKSITGGVTVLVGVGNQLMSLNPASFNTEEAGFFSTLDDFGEETIEKTLAQTIFKYEDEGQATVVITAASHRETKTPVPLTLGNVAPTGELLSAFADIVITDEYIDLRLDRAANAGPVVLTDIIPRIEPQGETRKDS